MKIDMITHMLVEDEFLNPEKSISVSEHTLAVEGNVHMHEFYEIEYVLEGTGEHNLNGTVYKIGPGSLFMLTPIDFHSFKIDGSMRVINVSFEAGALSPEWQMQFISRRHNLVCNLSGQEKSDMEALLSMFQREHSSSDLFSEAMQKNLLEMIFAYVARYMIADKSEASKGIQKGMQHIFQHFRDEISLKEIADKCGYAPAYFSSLFRKETGRSLTDFIADLRVNYAKILLANTELSITEVCQKSGFGSMSNFFRIFQTHGCSPSEYRNSYGNKAQNKE
ncbi:MAG: helix-turn-helix domain-containing protein [Clostridia bacterium]|nr:helix-turn-helix domain-containing protein [Clostridia bacterium]